MITITDPYTDCVPPDHLRDFAAEQCVTRECMKISAQLRSDHQRLLVRDDVLVVPVGISEDLKDRMVRLEPYLRWAAGKPATHWLCGGPANFPEGVELPQRTGAEGLAAERAAT